MEGGGGVGKMPVVAEGHPAHRVESIEGRGSVIKVDGANKGKKQPKRALAQRRCDGH